MSAKLWAKEITRGVLQMVLVLAASGALIVGTCISEGRWMPLAMGGPYKGRAASNCSERTSPTQTYAMDDQLRLETWDGVASESAVLLLRDGAGTVRWCIHADAGDMVVTRIRIHDHRGGLVRTLAVRGEAKGNDSDRRFLLRLGGDGALTGYWLDW